MTYTVTLNQIAPHQPCVGRWAEALRLFGKTSPDDEPIPLAAILDKWGLDAALWCLRDLGPEHDGAVRLLICNFAAAALKHASFCVRWRILRPTIKVARHYARGEATEKELAIAGNAARTAAKCVTGEASAWSARAAAWTTVANPRSISKEASWAANNAAVSAARGTSVGALRAASLRASAAAKRKQEKILRRWLKDGAR